MTIEGWHEAKSPDQLLQPGKALHVFLSSVAGVGEPPDNGRKFYDWITNEATPDLSGLEYAVFGLGSTAGHSAYFNVIGKSLDTRLEELGASRVLEIGLGDDGDCIEDDFDNWMESFDTMLKSGDSAAEGDDGIVSEEVIDVAAGAVDTQQQREQLQKHDTMHHDVETEDEFPRVSCPGIALTEDDMRMTSRKYPTIQLRARESEMVRKHLFHLNGTTDQFYTDGTGQLDVIGNKVLGVEAGESAMHEMKVILRDYSKTHTEMEYETGDHLVIFPQNSQCIIDAYLDLLDVDRHAIIAQEGQPDSYPFPKVSMIDTVKRFCEVTSISHREPGSILCRA